MGWAISGLGTRVGWDEGTDRRAHARHAHGGGREGGGRDGENLGNLPVLGCVKKTAFKCMYYNGESEQ